MVPLYVQDGYIVCFESLPEDMDFDSYWMEECGYTEAEVNAIRDCAWFVAKVSLWREGVEVACDYLGACCYKMEADFYTVYRDDYFMDMVNTCFQEVQS